MLAVPSRVAARLPHLTAYDVAEIDAEVRVVLTEIGNGGGRWMMRTHQAIIIAGILIAVSSGGAILLINRYEVSQPFDPKLFNRFDRWTGRAELCSSYYDEKTYCGPDLRRRVDEAANAAHLLANNTFLSLGYTQEEINGWPTAVLEGARNIVGNGGSKSNLAEFLKDHHVRQ
jgi:hypothetical protein